VTGTPTVTAAWLVDKRAALQVGPAPYTPPGEGEIVVANRAVAINPIDWIVPLLGRLAFPWIKLPFVLGADLAGEVVEVGPGVTRFAVGDRVLGHAIGTDKKRNRSAEGAFQSHTVVLERLAAPIPDDLSYERAAVLPLALSTAACGLFQTDQLALAHPSAAPTPTGETLLVWGGATSVGSNAIQLAVAAGYDVVTTCSPRNDAYVEELGASRSFDYRSPTVVADLTQALEGVMLAGAIAIGAGSGAPCAQVVGACTGRRFVSMASPPVSFDQVSPQAGPRQLAPLVLRLVTSTIGLQVRTRTRRIRTKTIFGSSLAFNEVSTAIYEDFLPQALADGRYRTAPEPLVVGVGLESLQQGLDVHRAGVSAQKIVVTL